MVGDIDELIKIVNKLQDCFSALGTECPIDLPQIVVVGEQSAGKSSVLENFVGKDFLPRGSGIVTRRPLVLQLTFNKGEEYATFLHTKDKVFTDFLEVRREIELETDRLTGSSKNISPIPINLRIFSPNVLNLTLVDLPGLTKVPVGDQPKDIEMQIRNMIMNYITNPNSLILPVTPAIIDLANSEALKMAREVDPDGLRTLGVITKIDMMDEGTNCKEVLENRVYFLKRGYVGIVNRSQKDIEGKKDIKMAQESEMDFFKTHPVYKHMIDRMGSRFLQKTLNSQLSQHIKETLPSLRQKILEEINTLENTMGEFLHKPEMNDTERTKIFMTLIQEFGKQVDVVLGYQQEFVDTKELSGGSVINKILYHRFPYELTKVQPEPAQLKSQINIGLINTQGAAAALPTPDIAFCSVTKKYIQETRSCCNRVPELVSAEIIKIIQKAANDNFATYPSLISEIMSFCNEQLADTVNEARSYINFYIDAEHSHINTRHPDFMAYDGHDSSDNDDSYPKANKNQEHNIYKKGYMVLSGLGFLKSDRTDYFILKGSSLISYKDERITEQKISVLLDGCRIKDYSTNYSSKKNCFQLYHKDGRTIGKDIKNLEFLCQNNNEAEEWKAAFMAAGVPTDIKRDLDSKDPNLSNNMDVNQMKQVEYIYNLVMSYLKIVNKYQVDVISKMCVYTIISKMRRKITTDIVARLVSSKNIDQLMKESEEVISERREKQQIYKACKEATEYINSIINTMGGPGGHRGKFSTRNTKQTPAVSAIYPNPSSTQTPYNTTSSESSITGRTTPQKPKRPPPSLI